MLTPFAGGGADFRGFGAPARHADLRGAVDDGRDAGGGTFRGDVEGGAGMLRLKLLRQLRHEFRAEGIGAFDDERSACAWLPVETSPSASRRYE